MKSFKYFVRPKRKRFLILLPSKAFLKTAQSPCMALEYLSNHEPAPLIKCQNKNLIRQ